MSAFFGWLNDQLLKMEWLEYLVSQLYGRVFGLDDASAWYHFLVFFTYDVLKIFLLLSILIFISSYLQANMTPERTRQLLAKRHGITAHVGAALLGTITPFCSCSSIPIFIGFTRAGLPLGVTFAFLISSPLVDLASVILLASVFNWTIALMYVAFGLVLAIGGGFFIGVMHLEDQIEPFVRQSTAGAQVDDEIIALTRRQRLDYAVDQVKEVLHRVWVYILIGVGIGAVIHGFVPEAWVEALLGQDRWYSIPLAVLLGVPMYADIFGTLPIAESLIAKGVGLGTAMAFMMAVTALSLPSLIMLKRVVKPRLLATFFAIVVTGIVLIGYVFNAITPWMVG